MLERGKLTLPLIYLLEGGGDGQARKLVQAVIREGRYHEDARHTLLEMVERDGALDRARSEAARYAEAARDALAVLPASNYTDALHAIPSYIIERDR